MVSRVPANEKVEEMIVRMGGELDVELATTVTAEGSELKHFQNQNNYFRDSWDELGAIVPAEHRTNSDTGSGFKGAGDCSGLCNSFEEILDSKINANYKIRFESEVKDFELDPNKTPPEAEPAKQPPPERDKIRRDRGLRARTPRTPNGTAKGCARYLILRISRSPDAGVEPCRLAATVGPKLC